MTREETVALLTRLEVHGRNVIVHGDTAAFAGGEGFADILCAALTELVGPRGTLVMPAFTYVETLPPLGAGTRYPSLPFHPDLAVSSIVGELAETFRHFPGVLRSNHPTHSFCAWGRGARDVLSTQRDNNILGPLKKLNVLQGEVVLLGASLHSATALHLAEEQMMVPYLTRRTAVRINSAGFDERVVLENVPGCAAAFDRLEQKIDPVYVRSITLANGEARRMSLRYLLQLGATALREDPAAFLCDDDSCSSCIAKRQILDGPRAEEAKP